MTTQSPDLLDVDERRAVAGETSAEGQVSPAVVGDGSDTATSQRSGRIALLFWSSVLMAVPGLLFFLLGVRDVEPINGQDGYLYVGIAARLTDFLSRFPDSYYGVRFGHIFPSWAFTKLFGFELGYYLWRLLLLGTICVCLRIGRVLRPSQAILAAVVVSASPVLLVSSFTTYTLSTGVLTLLVGSTLLATQTSVGARSWIRTIAAGAFFALSWNANFATFPICALIACGYLVDEAMASNTAWRQQLRRSIAALAAGTFLVVIPAVLVYGLRFGIWNIYAPTLAQARKSTDGQFLEPGWGWISWRHYLLVGAIGSVRDLVGLVD